MGQATEVYAGEFDSRLRALPGLVNSRIIARIRDIGSRLESYPHVRLQGRPEYRFRVGDYRVIYEFDVDSNEIRLITLGHRREIYRRP